MGQTYRMVRQAPDTEGVLWWRSRRSAVFDVALALTVAALPVLGIYTAMLGTRMAASTGYMPADPGPSIGGLQVALGVAGGLLLVLRRRFPAALAVVLVPALAAPEQTGYFAAVIALYTLAAYGRSRRAVAAVGLAAFAALLVPLTWTTPDPAMPLSWPAFVGSTIAGALLSGVVPVLLGLYVGARRALVAGLRERAERLERERHLLAQQALAEERARVAREMHDVVAHRVSLMVLHAGALEATADQDPRRTGEFTALIRSIGTQALDELRQVIGLLRVDARGDDAVPLTPQPTLDDVPALVEGSGDPDTPVTYEVTGEPRPSGATVERTAYRVVQEALTNARKHARGAPVHVGLGYRPDALEVTVTDEGSYGGPGSPPAAGEERGGATEVPVPGGGHGLAGMRERVTMLGGTFEAGPLPAGGFRIRAVLPVGRSDSVLEAAP